MKSVLGVGNPITDSYATIEENFLSDNNIPKGAAPVLEPSRVKELTKNLKFLASNFGGSAANTIKAVAFLGGKAGLLGQYADDESGRKIEESMKAYNIENHSIVEKGGDTTQLFALITPDAQRTMLAIFGASHTIKAENIDFAKVIKDFDYILIEGYQFCNQNLIEVSYKALEKAKELNKKVILSLSNIFCVTAYLDHMCRVMENAAVISGNEEEFMKLLDIYDLKDLISKLKELTKEGGKHEVVLLTLGDKGAYIFQKGKEIFIDAETKKAVDTTGSGDFFLGGFLYGYLNGLSIEKSAKIASILGGEICKHFGCDLPNAVRLKVNEVLNS